MKRFLYYQIMVFLAIGLFTGTAGALVFPDDSVVTVTYTGGSAGYDNEFGIARPSQIYLGLGHSTPPGTVFSSVQVPKNTAFVVYIRTPAGYTYYSDGANPDGMNHAVITLQPDGDYRIGFEDLYGGGDKDFNDIELRVHADNLVIPIPEFPILALPAALIIGMLGMALALRKYGENRYFLSERIF